MGVFLALSCQFPPLRKVNNPRDPSRALSVSLNEARDNKLGLCRNYPMRQCVTLVGGRSHMKSAKKFDLHTLSSSATSYFATSLDDTLRNPQWTL